MSDQSQTACPACDRPLEQLRYFSRQLLTAEDMTIEQNYFRQKLRRHNRYAHGWGVMCGFSVEAAQNANQPWQVRICPGYALAPQGDEILVSCPVLFDLSTGAQTDEPCAPCPCPPLPQPIGDQQRQIVYLAVRFNECNTRPVRVHPSGCACDDLACEYSRLRDDFNIAMLWQPPACYQKTITAEQNWIKQVIAIFSAGAADRENFAVPVPACVCCPEDPWVILATILLPLAMTTPVAPGDISYKDRRVLLSESMLWQALLHK